MKNYTHSSYLSNKGIHVKCSISRINLLPQLAVQYRTYRMPLGKVGSNNIISFLQEKEREPLIVGGNMLEREKNVFV